VHCRWPSCLTNIFKELIIFNTNLILVQLYSQCTRIEAFYFIVPPPPIRSGRFTVPKVVLRTNEARTEARWHRVFASGHFLGTFEKRDVDAQPLQGSVRQGRVRYVLRFDLSGGSDRIRTRKSRRGNSNNKNSL